MFRYSLENLGSLDTADFHPVVAEGLICSDLIKSTQYFIQLCNGLLRFKSLESKPNCQ